MFLRGFIPHRTCLRGIRYKDIHSRRSESFQGPVGFLKGIQRLRMNAKLSSFDTPSTPGFDKKRSAVTKGIQWDEETIAEHDKDRGTRQKIDEPPTPYSYFSYEDGDMNSHMSPSSDGAFSEKAEPNHLIDYSSDCEKSLWATGTKSVEGDKYEADEIDQRAALKKLRGSKVQMSSASVSDNWASLEANLNYQQQLRETTAPNESYMSCSKDPLSNSGISGIDSECCAESFHFSPGQNTENIEVEGVEDISEGRMEDYKDSAECDDFKNKRAAHYNEFKLVQAMRARQVQDDDDDDDDDG